MFFDNRGVGFSDAPKGVYSTSQMAQDTLELLDALGWRSDVHIAGVSMGGMISLELVLADPKRFSSLVLTSTNAGRSPPQLVTVSFLSRVILVKDPVARMKLICETLFPVVRNRKKRKRSCLVGVVLAWRIVWCLDFFSFLLPPSRSFC